MVDYHTHILPGMDDGSKTCEDSIRMLAALHRQGVDTVCLTPHFNGKAESPENFLRRRREAYARLTEKLPQDMPRLRLGAEVKYYRGVSCMQQLPQLRLEGTNILLLEMSFSPWSNGTVNEVLKMQNSGGFTVMLAHVERYTASTKNREILSRLSGLPVTAQLNAEYFINLKRRDKNGPLQLGFRRFVLGSDAHSLGRRIPNMADGRAAVESRFGMAALDGIDRVGTSLLWENLNG